MICRVSSNLLLLLYCTKVKGMPMSDFGSHGDKKQQASCSCRGNAVKLILGPSCQMRNDSTCGGCSSSKLATLTSLKVLKVTRRNISNSSQMPR